MRGEVEDACRHDPGADPPRDAGADLAAARATVLVPSDRPEYEAAPDNSPSSVVAASLNRMFLDCMHSESSVSSPPAGNVTAKSPKFKNGSTEISMTAITVGQVYPRDAGTALVQKMVSRLGRAPN